MDPRRGRADPRPARGAGPPVGADRGRQREPRRHRRPARPAARRRAHPGAAQRGQPRQGLLRAPRDAGRARRPAAALRRRLRELVRLAPQAAGRDRRGRRRRRRLAPRQGRAASAAASRCGAGSSGARSSLLCRAVLREPTSDLFCGFKLWRADAATTVYGRAKLDGWTFDAETLALARALGFRLREVGVEWNDREGSRLSMLRVLVPVVGSWRRRGATSAARSRGRPPSRPRPRAPQADVRALGVALGALAIAPLAGLLLRVASKGGVHRGWRRLPRARPDAVPQLAAAVRQPSADRQPLRPRARAAHVPAPGAADLGRAQRARGGGDRPPTWSGSRSPCSALWAGAVAWCRRFLPEGGRRVAAVGLALFFASPLAALVGWSGVGRLRRPLRLRLPLRRADHEQLRLGLLLHRHRGRADAARAARARARPHRARGGAPG